MAKYTYKLEDGEYVLYKDEKPLTNPDGVIIKTEKEELAKLLETSLKRRTGYTSPGSYLTYHYTYCNLKENYTKEFVAQDFSNCVGYDSLMNDYYLMFRQDCPIRQAIAVFFEKELPKCFQRYNLYQLTAILVFHASFDSWMLSHYIISDIIEEIRKDETVDIDDLVEDFIYDLEIFECGELGADPDDESYKNGLKSLSQAIKAFVTYFRI